MVTIQKESSDEIQDNTPRNKMVLFVKKNLKVPNIIFESKEKESGEEVVDFSEEIKALIKQQKLISTKELIQMIHTLKT